MDRFDQEPLLLYTLAQAREAQGNTAAMQEAVDRAMKLNEGNQVQHLAVADKLQRRGLLKWSEAEFRLAIKLGPIGQRTPCGANTCWPNCCTTVAATRRRPRSSIRR